MDMWPTWNSFCGDQHHRQQQQVASSTGGVAPPAMKRRGCCSTDGTSRQEQQQQPEQQRLRHSPSDTSISSALTATTRNGGDDPMMICDDDRGAGEGVGADYFVVAAPQQTFHHPFTSSFSSMTSRHAEVDVIRKEGHYEVQMDLPGYKPENVCLQLRQRVVHVCVSPTDDGDGEDGRMLSRNHGCIAKPSCGFSKRGGFSSTVRLPHDVEPENVSADMAYGTLRLWLPRGRSSWGERTLSSLPTETKFHDEMAFATAGRSQPVHVERLNW